MKRDCLKGKVVLISGGAGSFGQEFVRRALREDPNIIRVFDNSEYFQWKMQEDNKDPRLRFFIGDVRDRGRLRRAMNGVDIVVHAAALKHVPLCEYNPIEAVRTNIEGSINVIDTAIDTGVDKVLAISSDKAVHPINIYGATKLVMEKLIIQANVYGVGETKLSCVRFGNFYGSRGSFIPLLYDKLDKGEEITITDKEMARYWITLDIAVDFVVKCIEMMQGGEIFIPKMPQKTLKELINDLAPDVKLKVIGKRAGEKLTELLFNEGEEPEEFESYYKIVTEF